MGKEEMFDRSGSRLKRLIPQIFKWNVGLMLVGVVITFFVYLFNESVEDAFLALLVGTGSAVIEIGVMYFWMLNLYAHAEQSDNTCRMLDIMNKDAIPAAPTPAAPVCDVPAAKPAPQPAAKKETYPAPEKKPLTPAQKSQRSSFAEALSLALRFETDEGMRRQLFRLTEQEAFSAYREELTYILEEVPSAQQRKAAEDLLQKCS